MNEINWGQLQPLEQMAPIRSAAPQAATGSAPTSAPGSDVASGMGMLQQSQQLAIEKQKLGLLQQERADEHSKLPGQLQAQQLQNQGLGIANQGGILANTSAQQKIAADAYSVKVHQAAAQEFTTAKNKGGTQAAIDAMASKYMEMGDTDTGLKVYESLDKMKEAEQTRGAQGVINAGNSIANVMGQEVPPSKDPKTGQINPGQSALDVYRSQYKTIKQQWLEAPDPSSFKDNAQFHAAMTPVLATAGPVAEQRKAALDALKDNDLYKAQQVVKANQDALQSAIKQYGPKSQQATDAATALKQSQYNAGRVSSGNNYITGSVNSMKSIMPSSLGGDGSTDDLIKQNDPNPAVSMPSFSSKGEFQSWYSQQSPEAQEAVKAQLGK